jgi:hypothetical protein
MFRTVVIFLFFAAPETYFNNNACFTPQRYDACKDIWNKKTYFISFLEKPT